MTVIDIEEFQGGRRPNAICWRRKARLSPEQEAKLDAALASPDITARTITDVLNSWGVMIGENVVAKHRRGVCSCSTVASQAVAA